MNAPATQPRRLQPATCPLLAAVLPLRYAIGPIETRNPSTLDAATLGLPALNGNFPEMGPEHASLKDRPWAMSPVRCAMAGCTSGKTASRHSANTGWTLPC